MSETVRRLSLATYLSFDGVHTDKKTSRSTYAWCMVHGGVGVQGVSAKIKSRKESNEFGLGGDGSAVSEAVGAGDDALYF
jgi:hypothetical protein